MCVGVDKYDNLITCEREKPEKCLLYLILDVPSLPCLESPLQPLKRCV